MIKKSVSPLNAHSQTKDFVAFLRLKNLSPQTIQLYNSILRDLFGHLDPVPDAPGQASVAQLRAYVAGLHDRGLIQPGLRADFNLIDAARLSVGMPQLVLSLIHI